MKRFSASFLRDERGFAAGEFALWLPVILLIIFGCFDATRYIMIHQKLDRAATQAADLVGQSDGMTAGQLDDIYAAAIAQMEPYDMEGNGEIIVSSVWSDAEKREGFMAAQPRRGRRRQPCGFGGRSGRLCPPTFTSIEREHDRCRGPV